MPKQRNKSDCVIAALATATDTAYNTVKKRFGKIDRGGMLYHEIIWILNEFGDWKETTLRNPVLTSKWIKRHKQGRYVILLDKIFSAHAIAAVDGKIFGEYADSWDVTVYFTFVAKKPSC